MESKTLKNRFEVEIHRIRSSDAMVTVMVEAEDEDDAQELVAALIDSDESNGTELHKALDADEADSYTSYNVHYEYYPDKWSGKHDMFELHPDGVLCEPSTSKLPPDVW